MRRAITKLLEGARREDAARQSKKLSRTSSWLIDPYPAAGAASPLGLSGLLPMSRLNRHLPII